MISVKKSNLAENNLFLNYESSVGEIPIPT